MEQILESLPLRDAARTSVLSRGWRYKWLSLSRITLDLEFSETFSKRDYATSLDFSRAYSDAVNKILLRYRGPIHKFGFHVPNRLSEATDIDGWIEYVCLNGVKEFDLNYHHCSKWKPPSCLFSCVSLMHLTLCCGSLSPPPTFGGFPHLISLKLKTSEDNNQKLESLINNCPQLESLDLYLMGEFRDCLTIRSSKLKTLVLHMESIEVLTIGLIDLLSSVPNIEKLQLSSGRGCLYREEPPKLLAKRLEKLHTFIFAMPVFCCQYTISLVICLVNSSPHLSRLQIAGDGHHGCDFCDFVCFDHSCILKPLKHIQILSFGGGIDELNLVMILLAHSPMLELLTIELDMTAIRGLEEKFNLAKEVTWFCRASPKAKVVLI